MEEEQRKRIKQRFADAGERSALNKHAVSKSFYCLGDSFGESEKCDNQCNDCRAKILK